MLLKYIKAQNFTSYIDETIDFQSWFKTRTGAAALLGPNGAGKSSIIDMITTALFYRSRTSDARGVGIDDLINNNANEFLIELCFIMDNNDYKVIRTKKRGGNQTLQLYINNMDHTEKINETQNKILNIIKMNYDTFLDTICMGQGKAGNFMLKKPNERKDIFKQMLQLDKYDTLEKETDKIRKTVKSNLDSVKMKYELLTSSIEDIEELKMKLNELNIKYNDLNTELDKYKILYEEEFKNKVQHEQIKQQNDMIKNQKMQLETKINSTLNNIESGKSFINELNKQINSDNIVDINKYEYLQEQLNNEKNKTIEQLSSIKINISNLKNEEEKLKTEFRDLKQYNKGNCDFCGQDITKEYKNEKLNNIKQKGISINKKIKELDNNKLQLDNKTNEIQNKLTKVKNMLQQQRQMQITIEQNKIKLQNAQQKLTDLNNNLQEHQIEYDKIKDVVINDIEEKEFKDVYYKNQINNMQQEIMSINSQISIINDKINNVETNNEQIIKIKSDITKLEKDYKLYEDLKTAWGKSGIQALIIDNTLPQIEEHINKYLSKLSDNKISITFNTQKQNKSGGNIETLDIIVNDITGSRIYESYSGGEKMRIDFAMHIGLSKFLAQRSGCKINFFIVDEGIGSLDDEGKNVFVEMINELTTIFEQIFVISHIDEIKESFNNKILVYKDIKQGSKVKILN